MTTGQQHPPYARAPRRAQSPPRTHTDGRAGTFAHKRRRLTCTARKPPPASARQPRSKDKDAPKGTGIVLVRAAVGASFALSPSGLGAMLDAPIRGCGCRAPIRRGIPMRRFRPIAVAALGLACLSAAPPVRAGFLDDAGQYGLDRVNDFADIFRFRLGAPVHGDAYGAKARVTALLQLGYVHFDGHYAGIDRRAIGWAEERRTEGGISLLYGSRHEMISRWGNEFLDADTLWTEVEDRRRLRNLPYWDDGRGDLLGIGGEIATPIGAIDLGVYPSEALDFLTGFFFIDPFNDDQLCMDESWRYDFEKATTPPGPDLGAAARKANARRAALDAEIAERLAAEHAAAEAEAAAAEAQEAVAGDVTTPDAAPGSEADAWEE